MITAILAGAIAGAGLFLLGFALMPRRPSLARQIAALDAPQQATRRPGPAYWAGKTPYGRSADDEEMSEFSRRIGSSLAKICAERGWEFPSLRSNLLLAGKSFENYLVTKVLLGFFGLLVTPIFFYLLSVFGMRLPFFVPAWLSLTVAVIFFFLPDLEVKQKADQRRRDFRHAIGAFLDLVAMSLAGGRGVPEALMSASEIGGGWAMGLIKDTLANARITGRTPWQALGKLGEEIKIDELRDLSAALSLVAEDGAKVRESLTARAATLRRREIAELQGQAGERSQSMLVAQMIMCAGFMVFLIYPAITVLLGSST
ncbi:MAG TPA: type II secretion system F family protein [Streptosporangiaceae bacterium]|jgi:tight adherence protein C|nr:type II secretion system F family protein [Streptosporangiaceae bacterium]